MGSLHYKHLMVYKFEKAIEEEILGSNKSDVSMTGNRDLVRNSV